MNSASPVPVGEVLRIPTAQVFLPLLQPARYKGVWGGRGSAKSWFFAGYIIERSLMQKTDIVCLREVQKSLKFSVKKLLENIIQELGLSHRFDIQDKMIKSDLGGIIIFEGLASHTADSIKSLESFDIAWVEEAQSMSQRSLDILRPTIRKPGSELLFSWNPRYETDAIDRFFRAEKPPENSIIVKANYMDNPWLPDELRGDLEYDRERDSDKFRHVWLGEYERHSEAQILRSWTVDDFERPPGTIFRFGIDWGYARDPTVIVRGSVEGNRLYIDYEAWMVGCEIVNLPGLFRTIPESDKWWMTADSARPETISHMQRNGYPKISSSRKGRGSIKEGIEFLNSFDIVIHPRCKHVIDDFSNYKYKIDPDTDLVTNIIVDKNADAPDATRYMVEGLKRTRRGRLYGQNVEEFQHPVYDDSEELLLRRQANNIGWMGQ